jgi:hypothetical protein
MRQDLLRHFTALGLSPGASANDIRVAYRKLIQQWHPDRFAVGSLMQTTAEDHTKELNEAYDSLYKKRHYRKFLGQAAASRPGTRPAAAGEGEAGAKPPETPPPAPRPARRPPLRPGRRWWKIAAGAAGLGAAAGLIGFLLRSQGAAPRKSWAAAPAPAAAPEAPLVATAWPPPAATATAAPAGSAPAGAPAPPAASDRARARIAALVPPGTAARRPTTDVSDITIRRADPGASADPGAGAGRTDPARGRFEPPAPAAGRFGSSPEILPRTAPPAAAAGSGAEWDRRLDASEAELDRFEMGDSPERVRIVQGRPDETTLGAFRYGSSLVFFEKGKVSGWINGIPRLRIPLLSFADWRDEIDAITLGSTRGDVFRIQGRPDEVFADAYYYGTDAVFFAGDRVVNWIQTDERLRTRWLPQPPFFDPPR